MKSSMTLKRLLHHEKLHKNLSVPKLIEKALILKEGLLTDTGALAVTTGKYTGRSPKDRYIVHDSISKETIDWNPLTNQKISEKSFDILHKQIMTHLMEKDELFSFTGYAGADKAYQLPIQIINEYAWHNLFVKQMLIQPTESELKSIEPTFTILSAPDFKTKPKLVDLHSEAFIIISLEQKIILIGGTAYAGELKKAVFSLMNFLLPKQDVLPMHCSANVGHDDKVTLFFGLSGTGKTTLSADPNRNLIGDDEHGWSSSGIFNIEGGCYAKCSQLAAEKEPEIYDAIRYGAVLENVVINPNSRSPDYDDISLTENSRVAYPLGNMEQIISPSIAGHPQVILFLTADASGTLPPISKLTKEQAMYHFLSGYTSKLAGTEQGITEPEATFSACFGAPFLPLDPIIYAEMLGEKMSTFHSSVFLINTGWTGGGYGVGNRIALAHTRTMIDAAINGEFDQVNTRQDPVFGLHIPLHISGIPDELLYPQDTWEDKKEYMIQATKIAKKFHLNFQKFAHIHEDIKQAGPIQQ